jgi:hypothetical protein
MACWCSRECPDPAVRWARRLLPDGPHDLEVTLVSCSTDGLARDALGTDHQPQQVFTPGAIEDAAAGD